MEFHITVKGIKYDIIRTGKLGNYNFSCGDIKGKSLEEVLFKINSL